MRIDQLEAFVGVADTLSFSKPCKTLYVTQSTITKRIGTLEKELGVRLFKRNTSHVSLSDEGLAFYGYAKSALESIALGIDAVSAIGELRLEKVRIAYQDINSDKTTPALLGRFFGSGERYSYECVVESDPVAAISQLVTGEIDAAFFSLLDLDGPDKRLAYVPIADLVESFAINKDNPLSGKARLSFDDLRGQTLLFQGGPASPLSSCIAFGMERGIVDARPYVVEGGISTSKMVEMNLGIAPFATEVDDMHAGETDSIVHVPLCCGNVMHYRFFYLKKGSPIVVEELARYLETSIARR